MLEILHDWNFWKKELDTGKERRAYLEKCLRVLETNVVTAIIGVRRAGKSYLMRQVIKKLIKKGVKRENILMVNFEDGRFAEFYPKLLDEIYETYLEFLEIKDELDLISKKIEIRRAFNEYFEFGGFPEVVLSNEKKQLLLTYFDDILTKDIERRYRLKKQQIQ